MVAQRAAGPSVVTRAAGVNTVERLNGLVIAWVDENAARCIREQHGDMVGVSADLSADLYTGGELPCRAPNGAGDIVAVELKVSETHDELTFEVEYVVRPAGSLTH